MAPCHNTNIEGKVNILLNNMIEYVRLEPRVVCYHIVVYFLEGSNWNKVGV
jgi:hypothetical protein